VVLEDQVTGAAGEDRRQAAERDRFERAWQEHRPRVAVLVARLAGDPELAEDLTQEIAVRAFQGYAGFRGDASLYTWLYRIAVNVVHRHRERCRLSFSSLDTPEVADLAAGGASDPEAVAVAGDMRTRVWAALERLPDELRVTLILQLYEGLKYREIAAILDVPIGTVKSRLHHAVQRLKEEFVDAL
jgi:RNA polymerase sigma-70 factor, ECF subfamily